MAWRYIGPTCKKNEQILSATYVRKKNRLRFTVDFNF